MNTIKLGEVITHKKDFITINDTEEYKRCRVQLNSKGILLRDITKGENIKTKRQQLCKTGYFLVAEMDAKFGGYGIVPKDLDNAIVSSHYFLYEINERKLNSEYLDLISKTDIILKQVSAQGSTNYAAIRPSHVLNYEIPLPSLADQEAIVQKIKSFMAIHSQAKAKIEALQTDLKAYRKSILQEAIKGNLTAEWRANNPTEKIDLKTLKKETTKKQKPLLTIKADEMPFTLPQNWEWVRLGEIIEEMFDGPFGSNLKSDDYTNDGVQVIRIENIGYQEFRESKLTFISNEKYLTLQKHTVKEGDTIISSFVADGVRTAILPKLKYIAIAKADCFCLREYVELIDKKYFSSLLSSPFIHWKLTFEMSGMTRLRINLTQLKNLAIPLPPLIEQAEIVRVLEEKMATIAAAEEQLKALLAEQSQLQKSMMQEVFRG